MSGREGLANGCMIRCRGKTNRHADGAGGRNAFSARLSGHPVFPAGPPGQLSPRREFPRISGGWLFPGRGYIRLMRGRGACLSAGWGGGQKILRVSGTRNEWGEEMSGGPGPPEIRRIKADAGREGAEIFPACAGGARPVLGDEGRLERMEILGEKTDAGREGARSRAPRENGPYPYVSGGAGAGLRAAFPGGFRRFRGFRGFSIRPTFGTRACGILRNVAGKKIPARGSRGN